MCGHIKILDRSCTPSNISAIIDPCDNQVCMINFCPCKCDTIHTAGIEVFVIFYHQRSTGSNRNSRFSVVIGRCIHHQRCTAVDCNRANRICTGSDFRCPAGDHNGFDTALVIGFGKGRKSIHAEFKTSGQYRAGCIGRVDKDGAGKVHRGARHAVRILGISDFFFTIFFCHGVSIDCAGRGCKRIKSCGIIFQIRDRDTVCFVFCFIRIRGIVDKHKIVFNRCKFFGFRRVINLNIFHLPLGAAILTRPQDTEVSFFAACHAIGNINIKGGVCDIHSHVIGPDRVRTASAVAFRISQGIIEFTFIKLDQFPGSDIDFGIIESTVVELHIDTIFIFGTAGVDSAASESTVFKDHTRGRILRAEIHKNSVFISCNKSTVGNSQTGNVFRLNTDITFSRRRERQTIKSNFSLPRDRASIGSSILIITGRDRTGKRDIFIFRCFDRDAGTGAIHLQISLGKVHIFGICSGMNDDFDISACRCSFFHRFLNGGSHDNCRICCACCCCGGFTCIDIDCSSCTHCLFPLGFYVNFCYLLHWIQKKRKILRRSFHPVPQARTDYLYWRLTFCFQLLVFDIKTPFKS